MAGRSTKIFQDKIPYSGTVSPGKKPRRPAARQRGKAVQKTGRLHRLRARIPFMVRHLTGFFTGSSK